MALSKSREFANHVKADEFVLSTVTNGYHV